MTRRLRHFTPLIFSAALSGWLHGAAWGDRIVLADGRVLEGTIEKVAVAATTATQELSADALVTISMASARITLPNSQIQSVAPSTPEEKSIVTARDALRAGRYEDAASLLDALVAGGGSADAVAQMMLAEPEPLAGQLKQMTPEAKEALGRVLAAIDATAAGREPAAALRSAGMHLAIGDNRPAETILGTLGADFFKTHPDEQRRLANWLGARLQDDVDRKDYPSGLERLDQLQLIDPALSEGKRAQFFLQWARHLRDAGEFEQALQIYQQYLLKSAPQIAREFMRRTLIEADHTLAERGNPQDAVALYEKYGKAVNPDDARDRIAAIWHNLGWVALRRGDFAQAQSSFESEEQAKPGSGKLDLLQLEFRRRSQDAPPEDLLAQYQLGVWANDHELWEEALGQFRKALPSPIVHDNAQAYIDRIMNAQAERELKELMTLYQKGEYRDALEGIYAFQQRGYAPGYMRQAQSIKDLSLEAMQMQVKERPQQAEALVQQAERAFYQDRYAEAAEKLQMVVDRYKDTIVYPKAVSLFARVRERQSLADLERGAASPMPKIETASTSATMPVNPNAVALPPMTVPGAEPPTAPSTMTNEIDDLYRSLGSPRQP